jgi:outer membrane immunogenic protein
MRSVLFLVPVLGVLAFPSVAATYKAPPLSTACSWCGWYIGGNAGYEFNSEHQVSTDSRNIFPGPAAAGGPSVAAAITALSNFSATGGRNGFIGGGQIGYNWLISANWIVGLEADIDGIAGKGSSNVGSAATVPSFPATTIAQSASVSSGIDDLGSARARLGFLWAPNLLIYGTGGLAYGSATASTEISQHATGPNGLPPSWTAAGRYSETRIGWTAGLGGEWMVTAHWTAKIEYLHYDLGSVTYGLNPLVTNAVVAAPFTVNALQSTANFNGDVIRTGVNYKF